MDIDNFEKLLEPKLDSQKPIEVAVPEITIADVDFNELLELEQTFKRTEEILNRLAGNIYRLSKDQETCLNKERNLNMQMEIKRKEIIKRYKIDDTKTWQVDTNTKKVIYT